MKEGRLFVTLALGIGLTLALLWILGSQSLSAMAAPSVGPVEAASAPAAELHVCPSGCAYSSVQAAVDAASEGGIIKVASGTYNDVHSRPRNDTTTTGVVTQVVYVSKTVTIQGGYTITDWTNPDPAANPTTLDAQEQGRVLYITGSISPTIEGLRITGGSAYWLGGGAEDSLYRGAGGGVYVINATATLSNCWLFGNDAFYGGGLYPRFSDATLNDNTVSSNTAYDGGGLYLYDSAATLNGNTVVSNAAYNGGGLYLYDSTATLSSNTITSNTAYYSGGGLYLRGIEATISGNDIVYNTAVGTGGGLYLGDSDVTLSSNTISSNTVNWDGGGLYLSDSTATLNDNEISFNTARYGGGLRLYNNSPPTTLNGNTISSNTANYGGGLCLGGSAATLNDNTISANTAYTGGGGLHLEESAATLDGNRILSNTANDGGGLYLRYSDATLTNNVVANNQANSAGSGLYLAGPSPRLLHTTIARNGGGDGSGVYITGTANFVAMTNTILVSHTVGVTVVAGNTATLNGVLWYSNTINCNKCAVASEYTGNPAFAADGYHLTRDSAAIDRGVTSTVAIDIDGDARPQGSGYDLGADEFVHNIYLPFMLRSYVTSR